MVWAEAAMSLDHYQTNCNLFLSVRIPPECLLLLRGHELKNEKLGFLGKYGVGAGLLRRNGMPLQDNKINTNS